MILAEEDCYPQFHSKYFMSESHLLFKDAKTLVPGLKTQNETLLKSMPFIKKELSEYKSCKGAALLRSKDILNTLSKRGEARKKINLKDQELQSSNSQVWDHVH